MKTWENLTALNARHQDSNSRVHPHVLTNSHEHLEAIADGASSFLLVQGAALLRERPDLLACWKAACSVFAM